ncbi:MAG: DNA mismatch repair protein MutS [Bacteroidia bacterium]|nr:DNA mismatch repair protein MutS [Bacteroidia bacterium]MBT8269655.1 DNA mismatch repair protein MutS [Bacteroidia bacterium]NNL80724.1 DNA mismatch repair protein MutS [Flavobacteriaceae bacterium]
MIKIHQKTLEDLEFHQVLNQVAEHCVTKSGKDSILSLVPLESTEKAINSLQAVNEYKASYENESRIPNHGFDTIDEELKFLLIEDYILEIESIRRIGHIISTATAHIKYFIKFQEFYPVLSHICGKLEADKDILKEINSIIDKDGEIKDNASDNLAVIRKSIKIHKSKLGSGFSKALSQYNAQDYLDDIKESILDNRRVLAVKAMYRRKVKGTILGSSKTGSIVFIEPEAISLHQRELNNLEYEEHEEIKKILAALTDKIRPAQPVLKQYQDYLTQIDSIFARTRYALEINAVLPEISMKYDLDLKEAYHPLLLRSNNQIGEKTYPQSIRLNPGNRIIVISGPNAGGKSITLKTVGLLQLMIQSGILIPVHKNSQICFFNRILSDIGDNQSIENQLSTYSYRLKQMNYFLKKCNDKTLFLIDEFGTGSDPELGGALAEVFLEYFYDKGSFGVITTHYTNLKMLADELPDMQNANMLFDERSLKPIFKLVLGEAGSSFTFEVAQKNGIPYSLINKAKKRIERSKVRFDKTIAKLQKERGKLSRLERSLRANEQRKIAETDKLEYTNLRVQKKLEGYQELYDSNQRLIYLGQKVDNLAKKFQNNKRKRDLLAELFKIIQIENSRRKKQSRAEQHKSEIKERKAKREIQKRIEPIRKRKKAEKKAIAKKEENKPRPKLNVGDRVRLEDGMAVGSIDKIEKNKAIVNYGMFTTNVSLEQLELVEKKK